MALSVQERQALMARGHALKARATVSSESLSDGAVAHVRAMLEREDLVKVRVAAEDRETTETVARILGEMVPCDVVQRIGRVLLLHRGKRG